jgi:peroxiredoxin
MAAFLVVVATGWITAPGNRAAALCIRAGQIPPEITAQTLDGNPALLSDYRGKVVFLAFWASWCSRCREGLAFLKGLSGRFSDDVVVLAINQEAEDISGTHLEHVHSATAETRISFPVLLDQNLRTWEAYCTMPSPRT